MLISEEVNFRAMKIAKDEEGHYILTKGFIHQEGITVLNVYGPNNRIPRYMKQNR